MTRDVTSQETQTRIEMTGAEMVVEALKDQGVEMVFGYPGGAVLPIYDAHLPSATTTSQHILVRHEQGAGHAAEGYARSIRQGQAFCSSPPALGRPTSITALTDALHGLDSAGLHHRPGADPSDRLRRLPGMRHDSASPASCTKHNYLVRRD